MPARIIYLFDLGISKGPSPILSTAEVTSESLGWSCAGLSKADRSVGVDIASKSRRQTQ